MPVGLQHGCFQPIALLHSGSTGMIAFGNFKHLFARVGKIDAQRNLFGLRPFLASFYICQQLMAAGPHQ